MIDINLIRDSKLREKVIESEKKRFRDPSVVQKIHALDLQRIKVNYERDSLNKSINKIQEGIKALYKEKQDGYKDLVIELVNQSETLKKERERINESSKALEEEIAVLLKSIGNIIDESVVVSKNEEDNRVLRIYKSSRCLNKECETAYNLMHNYTYSSLAAKVFGHRGYYLAGKMARLGQALTLYAIDFLEERGYLFIQTPVMVRKEVMAKTAQLSDFDDQLYRVENDMYLIATSEQPLCALFMGERFAAADLPKMFCGQSLCFRKEAGAHGKDNQGLFRVHQFEKIEQFVICAPEESAVHHKRMIEISEEFMKSLDISYRVVSIVSGELNDAAAIKYDLEAWFPSLNKFRELISCSNCTDYQSRELEIRYGITKENNRKVYVHMLNSTLCAVQRTLCCIVENYHNGDTITVPEVLRTYFKAESFNINE